MTMNFMLRPFFRRETRHTQAANTQPAVALQTVSNTPLPQSSQAKLFISRQPIFDATEKVCAYQLLVRQSEITLETTLKTAEENTRLIVTTLNTFGVQAAFGDHLAFISLPENALDSDSVTLLPKANFVLEYPSEYLDSPHAKRRCAQLLAKEYNLARSYTRNESALGELPREVNYIVYDLAYQSMQEIAQLDHGVKPYGLTRVVRNVNTRSDFAECKAFDFDLYQGNFFAKAEASTSPRVDPLHANVVEIFNLVINKADVALIEDAFKRDIALCYSLLCYINSVGIGMQYKVSSIKHAILLLGYDFLWRWLSLLVYAGIDLSAAQHVLLNTAIIRGRLTELLGQMKLPDKEANTLFVVGTFSLLDALLGMPMEQALPRINLPKDVALAITRQEGKYAPYLRLALAFESEQLAEAERLCAELEIDLSTASRAHLAAIEWTRIVAK